MCKELITNALNQIESIRFILLQALHTPPNSFESICFYSKLDYLEFRLYKLKTDIHHICNNVNDNVNYNKQG